MGKYYVTIQSHLWNGNKEFNDFKSAIEYAKEMEAYYYGMLKYRHKGNANITIIVSSNMKADEEYHIEIISKDNILTSTWYYNGEHKEKRREVLDSKLNVGDSIELEDGRNGVVEDYDDKYYFIKDNNTNIIKIKKVKDETITLKELNTEEVNKLLSNSNYYIHFDNLQYSNNQIISKPYNYGEDNIVISEAYLKNCNIKVNDLVYMLKYYKKEYEEEYNYVYIVEANNAIKCQMDYSPLISYLDKPNNINDVKKYYELCSLAYINNKEAKKELKAKYDMDISFKEEYITNKAKVIQGYKIKRP